MYQLSRIAQLLADEIRMQDWRDAHSRLDGARHDRDSDHTSAAALDDDEGERIRMNVVWVVAQALGPEDPNFDVRAFAEAAGVKRDLLFTRRGTNNGMIEAGVRDLSNIEVRYVDGGWSATERNARPKGQLISVRAASPQEALETLLGG